MLELSAIMLEGHIELFATQLTGSPSSGRLCK
jgi:hypothetical protein